MWSAQQQQHLATENKEGKFQLPTEGKSSDSFGKKSISFPCWLQGIKILLKLKMKKEKVGDVDGSFESEHTISLKQRACL